MELNNKSQRAEAITIPDNDSAEQNEPQPNPTNAIEKITTPSNLVDVMSGEEQQSDTCPH